MVYQCFDTAGRQEGRLACKKLEWWSAGAVISLEQDAYGPADANATRCISGSGLPM